MSSPSSTLIEPNVSTEGTARTRRPLKLFFSRFEISNVRSRSRGRYAGLSSLSGSFGPFFLSSPSVRPLVLYGAFETREYGSTPSLSSESSSIGSARRFFDPFDGNSIGIGIGFGWETTAPPQAAFAGGLPFWIGGWNALPIGGWIAALVEATGATARGAWGIGTTCRFAPGPLRAMSVFGWAIVPTSEADDDDGARPSGREMSGARRLKL